MLNLRSVLFVNISMDVLYHVGGQTIYLVSCLHLGEGIIFMLIHSINAIYHVLLDKRFDFFQQPSFCSLHIIKFYLIPVIKQYNLLVDGFRLMHSINPNSTSPFLKHNNHKILTFLLLWKFWKIYCQCSFIWLVFYKTLACFILVQRLD